MLPGLTRMSKTVAAGGLLVAGASPEGVYQPGSLEELKETLKMAAARRLTLVPVGGGTFLDLGNAPNGPFALLDVGQALRGPIDHEPTDMTAVVPAGLTLGEIENALGTSGQWLPLDPPLPGRATVGGVVAVGTNGPLRTRYGLPRDLVLGMTVLRPDGTPVKAGGRVVKNVTGYDLMRLWTGSLGTLGIITEVSLRVLPQQETAWLSFRAHSFEMVSDAALALAVRDVRPEVFNARPEADHWTVLARVPAAAAQLARQVAGIATLDQDAAAAYMAHRDLGTTSNDVLVIRVNTTPRRIGEAVAAVRVLLPAGLTVMPIAGSLRAAWGSTVLAGEAGFAAAFGRIRAAVAGEGGSLVVERMPASWRGKVDAWGPTPGNFDLLRKTKQTFDPDGLLNRGRFAGGI